MRLVYFGTADFAIPALRALAPSIVSVVSQPDRPKGRGMQLQSSPVKRAATELGLPVVTPDKARDPIFVDWLKSQQADALVVAAYGQILSEAVLQSAVRGGINLHGSILPRYRGAAPIQRAILNGEIETGVTLMQMDKGMDSGDMIDIARTPIGPDETYGELQVRLAQMAADLSTKWLERIVAGDYPRVPQDATQMTLTPKIEKAEAELRFDQTASEAYRRFRAFTPAPGAFLTTRLGPLRLHQTRLIPVSASPGSVQKTEFGWAVAFSEESLLLVEVQPAGKRKVSGHDFVNGARLHVQGNLA